MKIIPRLALTAIPILTAAVCWTAIGSPSLAEAASDLRGGGKPNLQDLAAQVMVYAPDTIRAEPPYHYVDADTFELVTAPFAVPPEQDIRRRTPNSRNFWRVPLRIRVSNINAPETLKPQCAREGELAAKAAAYTKELLSAPGTVIEITNLQGYDDKGRYLATVRVNGEDLGGLLVAAGLARAWTKNYEGQTKMYWCQPTTAKRK